MNQTVENKASLPIWRKILMFIVIAGIGGLVLIMLLNYLTGMRLGSQVNAIAKSGQALNYYDLANIEKKAINSGQDAADHYLKATETVPANILKGLMQINSVYRNIIALIPDNQEYPNELIKAVTQNLATSKPLIDGVNSASQLPLYRYDLNVENGMQDIREKAMKIHGVSLVVSLNTLDLIRKGSYSEAVDSIISLIKLTRVTELTPTMLVNDIRNKIITIAVADTNLLLIKGELSRNSLNKLKTEYSSLVTDNRAAKVVMADRLYQILVIKNYLPVSVVENYFVDDVNLPEIIPLSSHHFRRLQIRYKSLKFLKSTETLIEAAMKPYPQPLKEFPVKQLKEGEKPDTMRNFAGVILSSAQIETILRSTILALQIELYHYDNKKFPESIEQLAEVDTSLSTIDPFSGDNLFYRHDEAGYLIYSVGDNGKDDGGAILPTADKKTPLDMGFAVRYGINN
ncbi:MAG: hypothetical protein JW912_04860 [Sedimentisphaerales bacterium]|nr:hypothetical protein [Sedimentisphaerales bacterium]